MKSHRILIFDISSEYGHFRKFNTTNSPLTFSIPPRPAIAGILGAILGIERELAPGVYPPGVTPVNEVFDSAKSKIAVQILKPVKKVSIGFNLINTKESFFNIKSRTQVEFELLKNPKFRLYLHHSDEQIFNALIKRIQTTRHHFSPYLGLSQFTATITWVDLAEAKLTESPHSAYTEIITAVNLSDINSNAPIQFQQGLYTTETIPMSMTKNRNITKYANVVIERNGGAILVNAGKYWITPYGNILFL